jgi:hypothetical protein
VARLAKGGRQQREGAAAWLTNRIQQATAAVKKPSSGSGGGRR